MPHAHKTTKIAARISAPLLLVMALAGCGADVEAGYVIDREYQESYVYYTTVCVGYDSQGICNNSMQVPNTQPERFTITVEDCTLPHDGDECPSESHTVPESTYQQATVGKYWSEDGGVVAR